MHAHRPGHSPTPAEVPAGRRLPPQVERRLRLQPALLRVWRGPGELQVGLSPRHGVVLDGLTAADARLLDALDGTLDVAGLHAVGTRLGLPPQRVDALVAALDAAGALVPGPADGSSAGGPVPPSAMPIPPSADRERLRPDAAVWSLVAGPSGSDGADVVHARARRVVVVVGAGRTGAGVATTLAAAGVGRVLVRDDARTTPADVCPAGAGAQDVGAPRATAVERAAARVAAPTTAGPVPGRATGPGGHPDVAVLLGHGAIDPRAGDALLRDDVPHLAVVVRESDAVVGPLVLPGRSPCLRCLDLHRSARDPLWPRVLAQLAVPRRRGRPPPEETALSTAVAGLAALQVLGHLDGRVPASVGATLEVALPDGLVSRRPWSAHPTCGCRWPVTAPTSAAAERMGS